MADQQNQQKNDAVSPEVSSDAEKGGRHIKQTKRKIPKAVFIVSIIAIILILALIIWKILDIYLTEPTPTDAFVKTTTAAQTTDSRPENPIDFAALQEINNDVYAWLRIPGDDGKFLVDQPILQSDTEHDEYYLVHDYKKSYTSAGSIFTQKMNSKDFSDPVTVMYGHNTHDEMFKGLYNYDDPDYMEEHKYFYIYTPTRRLTYEIFAAYVYDDRHIMNSFDFSDEKQLQEYIDSAKHPKNTRQNVREDVEVTTSSKIVTMSTCVRNTPQCRYLVQGVLIKDEPTR